MTGEDPMNPPMTSEDKFYNYIMEHVPPTHESWVVIHLDEHFKNGVRAALQEIRKAASQINFDGDPYEWAEYLTYVAEYQLGLRTHPEAM